MRAESQRLLAHAGQLTRVVTGGGQAWLTLSTTYLLALLAAGRRPAVISGDPPASLRMIVLIPAHNEELVIADAVAALQRQDYPADRFEIIVVANNCTDATAELARRAGATAWERHTTENGKGQGLRWAMRRIWNERPEMEAAAFVDADCEASPNFLSAIAGAIRDGADGVQADYRVTNVQAPEAALRGAGFRLKHVIRARGRRRLGLSSNLFGTGMAFSAELLREVTWPGSVTEDTELFLRIIAAGFTIDYVEHAWVSSTMPETRGEAEQQQLRWETGNAQLARAHLPTLVAGGIRGNLEKLGAAAELAVPSQSLMATGNLVLLAVALGRRRRRALALPILTSAGQVVYVVGGLMAAGGSRPTLQAIRYLPLFIAGRGRTLFDVARGRGARTWVRTARRN